MLDAPQPVDEAERLAALRALGLLDTDPEERFDRITRLTARALGTPTAFVNLVDTDRQWAKSCFGLTNLETGRRESFCGHAITDDDGLFVEDALADARFSDNPLVTGPMHIRAYAGQPVAYHGRRVGTLCVVAHQARRFTPADRRLLADLAAWVERELSAVDLERAAAELAASEHRLDALLRSLPDAVACFDAGGTVVSFNPAAELLFRRAEADVVGRPVADLLAPGDRAQVAELLAERAERREGVLVQVEVEAACPGGDAIPIDVVVGELAGREGEVFVAVARDIRARREVERLKDEFMAVVSHELRTPLTSIRASLGLLASGKLGDLDDRGARMVEVAVSNSDRLVRLVTDILDLDRLRTGRMPLHRRPLDLAAVCRTAVDGVAGRADEAGVSVEAECPPVPVTADGDRLVQVLTNLLGNAITYSPPGGTVRVGAEVAGGEVDLRVADQGRGIPEDQLDAVFAPFVQVDASDAREKSGSGLGLAIAQQIVEAHGGRIRAESPPGSGAVFHVTLPVTGAPGAADVSDAGRQPAGTAGA